MLKRAFGSAKLCPNPQTIRLEAAASILRTLCDMPEENYDIAVIGGGVVGLAILRRFAMAGMRCLLLEKGSDILSGASKGNSALLHTGFDAPIGSLELRCMQEGYAEYRSIRTALNLPLLKTSALVVAWNEDELEQLPRIEAKAHANGVPDVRIIGRSELATMEPELAAGAMAAVLVPGEHVIDPWSAPLAYAQQALAHGAVICRGSEVTGVRRQASSWRIETTAGAYEAGTVVNAAGLFGDRVESWHRTPPFTIKPRKGQFVVFDKPAARLLRAIVLPVPSERTKGVVLFRTIFGNLAIGPTAEETDERDHAICDTATLQALRNRAMAMVPALSQVGINAIYAGLRPATEHRDYIIDAFPETAWITVAGIRSTGLTSALGIASHVAALYAERFGRLPKQPASAHWTPVPNLAEHRQRPYETGGEILCHCERVTRGEIAAALEGPLPARDVAGLKRRTRAMMGRCQGFNCGAEILSMIGKAQLGTA